jgi:hypothetical protein
MQAKVLVEKLGVEGDFNSLNGWLVNFKKCHGIKCFQMNMKRPMWLMLRVLHHEKLPSFIEGHVHIS